MKTFFFFDFDEDDIITNLADTAPGNDVFAFSAGKKTEFAGTWNDESSDGSCFAVELQIVQIAGVAAVRAQRFEHLGICLLYTSPSPRD